jgi:glutathione S-transferase
MPDAADPSYELYYWPAIPGRGEFIRLPLEATGTPYRDVGRLPEAEGGGTAAILKLLQEDRPGPPLMVPALRCGDLVISQTAAILHWLAPRIGMAPADEGGRLAALQLQLTISDFLAEVHDVHHPIAVSLYYEDQKPESLRRSRHFLSERLPKFLHHFERTLALNGGQHAVGSVTSYVDLSLFQVVAGVAYAFPDALARLRPQLPLLLALHDRVQRLPRLAGYLSSSRRLSFSRAGLFRHYPELDRAG